MKVLIIDNYDSFTYNLVQLVEQVSGSRPDVVRNDKIDMDLPKSYDYIILSPGPGIPDEAGRLKDIIKMYAGVKPMLGVCLGQQAIAEVFGGKIINLSKVYHGVATNMEVVKMNEKLFRGMTDIFSAGRYHSWVVEKESLPDCLEISCVDENGDIMGLSHKDFVLKSVQFHPESILTKDGAKIIKNFLSL